jgi:hypothetical protein
MRAVWPEPSPADRSPVEEQISNYSDGDNSFHFASDFGGYWAGSSVCPVHTNSNVVVLYRARHWSMKIIRLVQPPSAGLNGKSFLSYTIRFAVNLEGDYGKSRERASGTSQGAQPSTVARGKVGSGNFGDRVVKR